MAFVPPYQVTVVTTAGGLARCSYVDGSGQPVPPGQTLTTSTPAGEAGSLTFNFEESVVDGKNLRLLGASVKTVGNDPTMYPYNYLYATRETSEEGVTTDSVTVTWSPDTYSKRGVVLLFGNLNNNGDMINFIPSPDPETQNDPI